MSVMKGTAKEKETEIEIENAASVIVIAIVVDINGAKVDKRKHKQSHQETGKLRNVQIEN